MQADSVLVSSMSSCCSYEAHMEEPDLDKGGAPLMHAANGGHAVAVAALLEVRAKEERPCARKAQACCQAGQPLLCLKGTDVHASPHAAAAAQSHCAVAGRAPALPLLPHER